MFGNKNQIFRADTECHNTNGQQSFFLIAYIPVVLFWLMDSYYLQQERLYRKLYNNAIKLRDEDIDMGLTPPAPDYESKTMYLQSVWSKTEAGFYIPLALAVAVVIYFAC